MFVLVVGGGKVGYYLTKELIENGHEVVLMEKNRARAAEIIDELGSIVVPHDGCEGKYLGQAGSNPATCATAPAPIAGWTGNSPLPVRRSSECSGA